MTGPYDRPLRQAPATGPCDKPRARRGGAGLDGKAERQTPLAELFAAEYRRQGTTEGCVVEGHR